VAWCMCPLALKEKGQRQQKSAGKSALEWAEAQRDRCLGVLGTFPEFMLMMTTSVKTAIGLKFIGMSLHLECFCLNSFHEREILGSLQTLEVRMLHLHVSDGFA